MALTLGDLWNALGKGLWPWEDTAEVAFRDVVIDSRAAVEGCLFVALPGEHTDGHLYVADAFRRGARAALVHRAVAECGTLIDVGKAPDAASPFSWPVCFLVPNTLASLQALAAYWRRKHTQCHVVGVTGSVGKTTTKGLIAAVLRQRFCTLSSPENYNNEVGLPLSVLRLHSGVEWLVQEMGMYDVGEITLLAKIALPEVGVVTNVGPTHLERLGTIERIAQAKAELVQALPPDGLAVLNGDDERVRAMASLTPARKVLYYGLEPHNDLWADEIQTRGLEGLWLRFHFGGQSVPARLPLLGRHSVHSALAAAAVGLSQGLTWEEIIAGLQDRSAQVRLIVVPGIHGTTILDDTYNASPASTLAALNLLAEMDGRKVAVLGGMLELGSYEEEGHRLVGRRAADVASVLVTVGRLGRLIAEEALAAGMPPAAVYAVADNEEAVEVLRQILAEGDFVLVKGSRGIAMEHIVAKLARSE
ncbi:MAG: UDP-N-acetylmuramoyl-tripeptide--D-alanyl-D-alanine ligase [Chloroflexi bacterium]|nr:UDP-N-acetylmuramoyl-tripeptide--D-alanyl-D-alanine ligase [Chloroflexota bacterium]